MQKIKLNYINRTLWAEEKCLAAATISASGPPLMGDSAFVVSIFSPSLYPQKRKAKDLQTEEYSLLLSFLSLLILLTQYVYIYIYITPENDQTGTLIYILSCIRFWRESNTLWSKQYLKKAELNRRI